MIDALVTLKAGAPAAAFVLLFLAERLRPAAPFLSGETNPHASKKRLGRNFGVWAFFLAVSPSIALPLTTLAASHPLWNREGVSVGGAMFLLDLIVLDLWTYALHRGYHRSPLLWRLHAPHHFDEHLDTTTAGRIHFGEILLSAALRMPIMAVLAIPLAHVVVYDALLMTGAFFHHSNLLMPRRVERLISRVFVTPSLHWVHHHAFRGDTDSNYGGVLSVWDPIFGTRSRTKRTPTMKIGVEGERDRPLWMLLVYPVSSRPARR